MKMKKGQSTIEYVVITLIVLGAFVATSAYLKRGIQGRWRQAIDGVGEQYDPTVMNTRVRHSLVSESYSELTTEEETINGVSGYWTNREDHTNMIEQRTGTRTVGAY